MSIPPEVLWAQRSNKDDTSKNVVYLTIRIADPENIKVDLQPGSLEFDADSRGSKYHLSLEFFDEVDVEKSKYHTAGSHLFFVLQKKNASEEFWPRLTKEKVKLHYLHTDFDRWVDEDEQDGEEADPTVPDPSQGMDFSSLMNNDALSQSLSSDAGQPDMAALMQQLQNSGAGGLGGEGDQALDRALEEDSSDEEEEDKQE
ncbi:hypothetical protein LJB42_002373 [Komagataella kurtzmanii]|nr:hypothetical protein LJB42_002373 [Komagataella kurtzmanii]